MLRKRKEEEGEGVILCASSLPSFPEKVEDRKNPLPVYSIGR
jgi:hypothetical protein